VPAEVGQGWARFISLASASIACPADSLRHTAQFPYIFSFSIKGELERANVY